MWGISFSFVYAASSLLECCAKDWRQIVVYDSEVVPNSVRIFEGTPVIAYCGSSFPVTWMYKRYGLFTTLTLKNDPLNIGTFFQYQLLRTSIILNNLEVSDAGMFICQGAYNNQDLEIIQFRSKVRVDIVTLNRGVPLYNVTPNYLEVSEGDTVTLTCKGAKPVEWFSVSLKYQNKTIYNDSIKLTNLKKEHSGLYFCRGITSGYIMSSFHGTSKPFHSMARIIVDGYTHRSHKRQLPRFQRDYYANYL